MCVCLCVCRRLSPCLLPPPFIPLCYPSQSASLPALSHAQIANEEIAHVDFLRSALGSNAIPQPAISIDSSFAAAANAAFKTNLSSIATYSAYATDALFLLSAFIFEDVGVTAYRVSAWDGRLFACVLARRMHLPVPYLLICQGISFSVISVMCAGCRTQLCVNRVCWCTSLYLPMGNLA